MCKGELLLKLQLHLHVVLHLNRDEITGDNKMCRASCAYFSFSGASPGRRGQYSKESFSFSRRLSFLLFYY